MAARAMRPTTARELVEREFARGRDKRFAGSVWRLGEFALTRTDGQLTEYGHVFRALRPEESLSHFDRSSERATAMQARAVDAIGRERVVGRMVDGTMMATPLGQAYYGRGSAIFEVRVPGWRRDQNGQMVRAKHGIPLNDQWLRLTPGGSEVLLALQRAGQQPPAARRPWPGPLSPPNRRKRRS